jgi:serine/threonine-protein kinase RsbW
VRGLVQRAAEAGGLVHAAADNLVLAVSEITTNAVLHGGGYGSITIERYPGVLVEISHSGPGLPPATDHRRSTVDVLGGHGLWIAQQMCAQPSVRSRPSGVTMRMFMPCT